MVIRALVNSEWYVYLLHQSGREPADNRGQGDRSTYVGITNDLTKRLNDHNRGKCRSTSGRKWTIQAVLIARSRTEAAIVERWLKCGDSATKRVLFQQFANISGEPDQVLRNQIVNRALVWYESKKVRERYAAG